MTLGHVIEALFVGGQKEIATTGTDEWWDKAWRTGFYKLSQTQPCWLGYEGFRGDEQADRQHHGGVDKAVCVYPFEHYAHWRESLGMPDLPLGAFGENLTLSGLVEDSVFIGDVFSLGEAIVQVSQPRQPCWKLSRRWRIKDLSARVEQTGRTGYYFRVLRHGWVGMDSPVQRLETGLSTWSITQCNHIMHHAKGDFDAAKQLSECGTLSASWKDQLWRRTQGHPTSNEARLGGVREKESSDQVCP
jgi:MOSC domain-containing protein YiiM